MEQVTYVTGIAHIAIQVKDLESAIEQYSLLGFTPDEGNIIVEEQFGIQTKVMRQGDHVLELLSPLNDDSPLAKQMVNNKWYMLDHICYEVSDLDAQIDLLKKKRFIPTSKKRVSGVWGKTVILMGHRKMGVIELIEK